MKVYLKVFDASATFPGYIPLWINTNGLAESIVSITVAPYNGGTWYIFYKAEKAID